jgi:outer membrane murein-binding lipoprotein Lpp
MDYSVEARIARLESDVSHLRTDVADIKTDLRSLRDRMDAKFDALTHAISRAQMWALMLYIALAAGVFGTMASGFGWI